MRINNFSLIKKIGEGIIGPSYLICDKNNPDDKYVLKLINRDTVLKQELGDKFHYLKKLYHPYLAEIIDFGLIEHLDLNDFSPLKEIVDAYEFYYIRRYYEGKNFYEKLQNENYFNLAIFVIRILDLLYFLHQIDLPIYNLKAENIIITENNDIKILDYGILTPLTPNKLMVKNIEYNKYMSYYRIERKLYNVNDDFYSLLIVILQTINKNKLPFDDYNLLEMVHFHMNLEIINYINNLYLENINNKNNFILKFLLYSIKCYFKKNNKNLIYNCSKFLYRGISNYFFKYFFKNNENQIKNILKLPKSNKSLRIYEVNKLLNFCYESLDTKKFKWINIEGKMGTGKRAIVTELLEVAKYKNIKYCYIDFNLNIPYKDLMLKFISISPELDNIDIEYIENNFIKLAKKVKTFLEQNNILLIIAISHENNIKEFDKIYFYLIESLISIFYNSSSIFLYLYRPDELNIIKNLNISNYLFKSSTALMIRVNNFNLLETLNYISLTLNVSYYDYYLGIIFYKSTLGNPMLIKDLIWYLAHKNILKFDEKNNIWKLSSKWSLKNLPISKTIEKNIERKINLFANTIYLDILQAITFYSFPILFQDLKKIIPEITKENIDYLINSYFLTTVDKKYYVILYDYIRNYIIANTPQDIAKNIHKKSIEIIKEKLKKDNDDKLELYAMLLHHLEKLDDIKNILNILPEAILESKSKLNLDFRQKFIEIYMKYAEKSNDTNCIIKSKYEYARLFFDKGNNNTALEIIDNCINNNTISLDLLTEGMLFKGEILCELKNYDDAINLYIQIFDLDKNLEKNNVAKYLTLKDNLWKAKTVRNYDNELEIVINEMEKFIEENKNKYKNYIEFKNLYLHLGNAHAYNKKIENSYKWWKKYYSLVKDENEYLLSTVLNNLGVYYSRINNETKSLWYYYQSHMIDKKYNNPSSILVVLFNILKAFYSLGFSRNALLVYSKLTDRELNILTKSDTIISIYYLISEINKNIGNFEKAYENRLKISRINAKLYHKKDRSNLLYEDLFELLSNYNLEALSLNIFNFIKERYKETAGQEEGKHNIFYFYYYKALMHSLFNVEDFLPDDNIEDNINEDSINKENIRIIFLALYERYIFLNKNSLLDKSTIENLKKKLKEIKNINIREKPLYYLLIGLLSEKGKRIYNLHLAEKYSRKVMDLYILKIIYYHLSEEYFLIKDKYNYLYYLKKYVLLEKFFYKNIPNEFKKYYNNKKLEKILEELKEGDIRLCFQK